MIIPMRYLLLMLMLSLIPVTQAAEDRPTLSGAGGASGIGQYPPNSWGVAATIVNNPTDQDQLLRVTFHFEETATRQFAVDVWVPAFCRRSVWLPMRTNDFEIEDNRSVTLPLVQQLIDTRAASPIVHNEARGMIIAARDRWITGMLADGDNNEEGDDDGISMALAMRRSLELSRRLAYLTEQGLPTMPAGWEGLNALVIAKNSPNLDSAQIQALRQWLLSGGKLWVMLDQVEPQVMASLLGESWTLGVVDRVPLSTVMVEPAITVASPRALIAVNDDLVVTLDGKKLMTLPVAEKDRAKSLDTLRRSIEKKLESADDRNDREVTLHVSGAVPGNAVIDIIETIRTAGGNDTLVRRDHEQPVDLVRVLPEDFEVTHTINGWPAALRKPIGKGWLMVTTVEPRGWYEPMLVEQTNVDGTQSLDNQGRTMMMPGHIALRPLRDLADWFHQDRRVQVLPPQAFDNYLGEQIGYKIVSRGVIFWVLMVFAASLLGTGLWLSRGGRLEHLAWVGVCFAIVVTIVLIVIGLANRSSVPMTVAQAQFVQIAPDQQQAISSGLTTIYNSGEADGDATLRASAGGLMLPASWDQDPTREVRMVWTDFDRWHWENVRMPSGANTRATFSHVTPLRAPVHAAISFDEQGVIGQLETGELGTVSNLLLATPFGAMSVKKMKPDGTFTAGREDALAGGQYAGTGVLDDAQRRRQDVLRVLLGGGPSQEDPQQAVGGMPAAMPGRSRLLPFPESPTLLGWTDALPLGFELTPAKNQIGTALISIPLSIHRPATGSRIYLPSVFVPYQVQRGRYGATPAVYVEDQRKWNYSSVPGTLPLAFSIPAPLLPVRVTKAHFTLDIAAPNTAIEILVDRDGQLTPVDKRQAPDGVISIDLPVDAMQPDADGRMMVIFRVSYTSPGDRTLWLVKEAKLEIEGVVEEPRP